MIKKRGSNFNCLFWQTFRLIFVFFSLYLMGYAFYRWDGFRYYASLPEFLPSLSLATLIWGMTALVLSALLWATLTGSQRLFRLAGADIRQEYLLFFLYPFFLLVAGSWFTKRLIWKGMPTGIALKLIIIVCLVLFAVVITWFFRKKASTIISEVQGRITPLFVVFSVWFIVSVPIVVYNTWIREPGISIGSENTDSLVNETSRPNILLVSYDALTARDMSVYGYARDTTPFLNDWAGMAHLFLRAEAEGNFTTPTVASMMTGKRIWTHQTYHLMGSKPVMSSTENLFFLLKNNGYHVSSFIVNPAASAHVLGIEESADIAPSATEFSTLQYLFRRGQTIEFGILDAFIYDLFAGKIRLHDWVFEGTFALGRLLDMIIPHDYSDTTVPPSLAYNKFLSLIEGEISEPFFAWIHLLPPHAPYLPPVPHHGLFADETDTIIQSKRAAYDEFIRYCDEQFKFFIQELQRRKILNDSVVIFTADHGESFEHDYIGHGKKHLYEAVTHIPLIIREPGQVRGRVINELVEQIDIPATILDLAGIPVPLWMEGRSLRPLMDGKTLPLREAFSMDFKENPSRGHRITKGTVSVWSGDYKLIHYLETGKSLLFNLRVDPGEMLDISGIDAETADRLERSIYKNIDRANSSLASVP